MEFPEPEEATDGRGVDVGPRDGAIVGVLVLDIGLGLFDNDADAVEVKLCENIKR